MLGGTIRLLYSMLRLYVSNLKPSNRSRTIDKGHTMNDTELDLIDYCEDLTLDDEKLEWLTTDQALWLTRQDEIINFW